MPDTTLTINHADGGSETYTINRDKFEGIRTMTRKLGEIEGDPENITAFTVSGELAGTYTKVNDNSYQKGTDSDGERYNKSGSEWYLVDYSSDEFEAVWYGEGEYPWEVNTWINISGSTAPNNFRDFVGGTLGSTITDNVSVDHTPPEDLRNLLIDAENITINRDKGEEFRTLFIDGVEVTIDRTGEVIVKRLLDLFTGASAAYSLQSLKGTADQALINARRGSDGVEVDVYPDNTNNREVSASSPITVTSGSSTATTFGEFVTEESSMTKDAEDGSTSGFITSDFVSSSAISTTSSNPISGTKSYLMSHTGTSGAVGYPRLDVPRSSGFVFALNKEYRVQFKIKLISGTTSIAGIRFGKSGGGAYASPRTLSLTLGQVIEYDGIINATSIGGNQILNLQFDGTDGDFEVLIDDIKITANEYDCTVTTWYDQSGNNNDASQSLDDAQPKIAENGSVVADGIDFDGTATYLQLQSSVGITGSQARSLFVVAERGVTGTPTEAIFSISDGTPDNNSQTWNLSPEYSLRFSGGNVVYTNTNINEQHLLSVIYPSTAVDSDDHIFAINGSIQTATSSGATTLATDDSIVRIGLWRDGGYYDGSMKELVLYDSDQSDNRTAIESNINGRYSIY